MVFFRDRLVVSQKRAVKVGAYKYAVTKKEKHETQEKLSIFSRSVLDIQVAMHTIVVKTHSGMASAVAASLDMFLANDMLGTIAGDDTILVIAQNPEKAEQMVVKLRQIFFGKVLKI